VSGNVIESRRVLPGESSTTTTVSLAVFELAEYRYASRDVRVAQASRRAAVFSLDFFHFFLLFFSSQRLCGDSLAHWKATTLRSPAVQRFVALNSLRSNRVHTLEKNGWFLNPCEWQSVAAMDVTDVVGLLFSCGAATGLGDRSAPARWSPCRPITMCSV
jgi:hypothetical protein